MLNSRTACLAILLGLLIAGMAPATVPEIVKLQGFLTDDLGDPIDGLVNMEFDLFDAQSMGSLIKAIGPLSVQVQKSASRLKNQTSPETNFPGNRY